jgi:hypothetical protein
MKKLSYLIVIVLISSLVLTGCLLSNVGQVPATEQSGITYLTKTIDPFLDLVGLWQFDEGGGTTASDSSGYGNDGTITGGATYAGSANAMFGDALSFNGIDGYVTVPDDVSLDIAGSITVEGWIKLTSFSQPATVAGKWKDIGGTSQRGYMLAVGTDGTPRFYVSTNGINFPRATGSALSLNTWYHLAGTYDGANINLYVGTTPSSIAYTESIFLNDQPLLIGANDGFGGSSRKFTNGIVDEVRVWSSVLDASQLDDMLPPKIIITTPAEGATYLLNQVVNTSWSVVDDDTGSGPGSGLTGVASESETVPIDTSTVGEKTFEVTATDYAKNTATETVTYTVIYDWDGFFPPVDDDVLNVAKAGSAIPVKFSLNGDQGLTIFEAGYPKSEKIVCSTIDKLDEIEATVTAGGSSLNYDASADQYIYVWKTNKGWADTCRQLEVKLNDGTSYKANFTFK